MSDKLGPIMYGSDNSNPFLGKEYGHISDYSERTASEIDEEVKSMIMKAYDDTIKILSDHIDILHRLAGVLYEKEKVEAKEFIDVMEGRLLPSITGEIPDETAEEVVASKNAEPIADTVE